MNSMYTWTITLLLKWILRFSIMLPCIGTPDGPVWNIRICLHDTHSIFCGRICENSLKLTIPSSYFHFLLYQFVESSKSPTHCEYLRHVPKTRLSTEESCQVIILFWWPSPQSHHIIWLSPQAEFSPGIIIHDHYEVWRQHHDPSLNEFHKKAPMTHVNKWFELGCLGIHSLNSFDLYFIPKMQRGCLAWTARNTLPLSRNTLITGHTIWASSGKLSQ